VFAFDFAFGLGSRGVTQADVIELESPAQLREGVGILGEEETVVIDIELQGPVNRRLQSSSMLSMGKGMFTEGNQRWGEASNCQSSPMRARCQRRTGACGRLGGVECA
jgi:hypothetical protein